MLCRSVKHYSMTVSSSDSRNDFKEDVEGLKIPTLICIGEHDHAFSKEAMESTYLAWLPNSQLEIIANAGHYPMQEVPVNLVTIIENFIKKNT